jgi:hypothetical protein
MPSQLALAWVLARATAVERYHAQGMKALDR